MWYGGNVFTQGTHGADVDMDALTDRVFDPEIDLKEKEDGWHLRMKTSVEWRNAVKRKLVHTGMLGKAIIPQQNFTLLDGGNLKIDKDFSGIDGSFLILSQGL